MIICIMICHVDNHECDNDSDIDYDGFIADKNYQPYINDAIDKYEMYDITFKNLSF